VSNPPTSAAVSATIDAERINLLCRMAPIPLVQFIS
jgi:hypothetical protein